MWERFPESVGEHGGTQRTDGSGVTALNGPLPSRQLMRVHGLAGRCLRRCVRTRFPGEDGFICVRRTSSRARSGITGLIPIGLRADEPQLQG